MIEPTLILPFLYLGTYYVPRNAELMQRLSITHVLSVKDSERFSEGQSFKFLHVPLSDFGESELIEVCPACFQFILEAKQSGGRVLVHCRYGMNRSPTIVISYLMVHEGMSLRDALLGVVAKHPDTCPHAGYLRQLQEWEKELRGSVTLTQEDVQRYFGLAF